MNSLGRGLSALIPDIGKSQSTAPQATKNREEIAIAEIKPNPHQPRKHFDEVSLNELASSIKEHGILQPLIVSKNKSGYELIAGERRLKAAKKVGLKMVPAIVRDPSEQQKLEFSIIENIQRSDLNPIEEAHAYQNLHDDFSLTHEQIAQKVGKNRVTITNTIRLLELPVEIQEGLGKKKISTGHAKVLLEITDKNQQIALFQKIIRENLTVRRLETQIHKASPTRTRAIKVNHPELEYLAQEMGTRLGTKVTIGPKESRGRIAIEYFSKEELDEILRKLGE